MPYGYTINPLMALSNLRIILLKVTFKLVEVRGIQCNGDLDMDRVNKTFHHPTKLEITVVIAVLLTMAWMLQPQGAY